MPNVRGSPSTRSAPLTASRGRPRTPSPTAGARRRSRRRTTAPTAPAPRSGRCRDRRRPGSRRGATAPSTTATRRAAGCSNVFMRISLGFSGMRQRGRRHHERDAVVALGRSADVEVGAERAGDLLREERADRLARDAAHDLADEVALRDRVVARRGARLPPRRLRGEQGRALLPVVEVVAGHRLVPTRTGRRCGPSGGGPRCPSLPFGRELGPVRRRPARGGRARRGRRASARTARSSSWSSTRR